MHTGTAGSGLDRLTDWVVGRSHEDRLWLSLAVVVGLAVHVTYLLTHPYPAYGAGLYLAIAEQIAAHGYGLPATIPGYTAGGVPFAYPPLGFYLAAVVHDLTGVGPYAYSRLLPGLLVTAALVPYYYAAREVLGSPRRAGVATLLLTGTPAALQWHLSAGGIVRGLGFLLAVAAVAAAVRLFRRGERRWLLPTAVLFGLTVLTHPVYALFVGLSCLVLFAGYSRTPRGLAHGAVVAVGGIALAAPWWLQVVAVHGVGIFGSAAGTHGGVGGGLWRLVTEFVYPVDADLAAPFFLAAYAGAGYALWRRRVVLPAWLFVAGYGVGKPRFLFVPGSMLAALFLFEVGVPAVRRAVARAVSGRARRRTVEVGVVALVMLAAAASGTAFAAGALSAHDGDPSQPAFVDREDEAAMAWVARETDPSADFVVLGDAAEWFPLETDRTILVGPWGVEWTEPARYEAQLERYQSISDCDRAACVTEELRAAGADPTYVYVPKGHYTVRGMSHEQAPEMRASFVAAERYEVVYENSGVLVVRVDPARDQRVVRASGSWDPASDGGSAASTRSQHLAAT
jgi:hypothetical protein